MIASARHPLIVATDRLPLSHQDTSSIGQARAHGALMQLVASRGGAWVAADTGESSASSWLNPLNLQPELLAAHRDGYCANTLASIYFGHEGTTPPQDPQWAAAHHAVSQRYAHHIAGLAAPGATVWVHDYPLQLVPGMLRGLRPDLRIGYSSHSPFPAPGTLLTVAEHGQILSSLLAADLCGFPDVRSAANFTGHAHAAADRSPVSVVMPLPVETQLITQLAADSAVQANATRIRYRLRPATTILLAFGGCDPGDGALTVLHEYQQLLADGRLDPQSTVLIHLTQPGGAAENHQTRQDTERLIAQINGTHAALGHLPVQHQRGRFTLAELVAFYLAADVMLAVPTRDRTTFEAADYVAARGDGTGRLVLSEFSSTSAQLPAAKLINPHVPDALAEAICRATSYARTQSTDMATMRRQALADNVGVWAQTFLRTLTRGASRVPAADTPLPLQQGKRQSGRPNSGPGNRLAASGSHS